jgi:hypothetical protein
LSGDQVFAVGKSIYRMAFPLAPEISQDTVIFGIVFQHFQTRRNCAGLMAPLVNPVPSGRRMGLFRRLGWLNWFKLPSFVARGGPRNL